MDDMQTELKLSLLQKLIEEMEAMDDMRLPGHREEESSQPENKLTATEKNMVADEAAKDEEAESPEDEAKETPEEQSVEKELNIEEDPVRKRMMGNSMVKSKRY